ncbi:hypothetical protein FRB93_003735 [Tulasnella sp. JGI-2019a]|nr:hypothetical protein FRB93_003735 [Tulasnella sp. JGI-2019a]
MRGIIPYADLNGNVYQVCTALSRSMSDQKPPSDLKKLESPINLRRVLEPAWNYEPPQRADVIQCYRGVQFLYSVSANTANNGPASSLEVLFAEDHVTVEAGSLSGLMHYLLSQRADLPELKAFRQSFLVTFTAFTTAETLLDIVTREYGDACYHDSAIRHKVDIRYNALVFIEEWLENGGVVASSLHMLSEMQNFVSFIRRPRNVGEIARRLDSKLLELKYIASRPAAALSVAGSGLRTHVRAWLSKRTPIMLAEILTDLGSRLYIAIRPTDCVAAIEGSGSQTCLSITGISDMHHKLSAWVKSAVLEESDATGRARRIESFIATAMECRTLGNFPAINAIVLALTSPVIYQLQRTREKVSKSAGQQLKGFEDLMEEAGGYLRYRSELLGHQLPIIPITHIHLRIIRHKYSKDPLTTKGKTGELINFQKYARLHKEIRSTLRYQDSPHDLQTDAQERRWVESQLREVVLNEALQTRLEEDSRRKSIQEEADYNRLSLDLRNLRGY